MMAKTIITAALTGAVTPKTANPNIPLTPKEIDHAKQGIFTRRGNSHCPAD